MYKQQVHIGCSVEPWLTPSKNLQVPKVASAVKKQSFQNNTTRNYSCHRVSCTAFLVNCPIFTQVSYYGFESAQLTFQHIFVHSVSGMGMDCRAGPFVWQAFWPILRRSPQVLSQINSCPTQQLALLIFPYLQLGLVSQRRLQRRSQKIYHHIYKGVLNSPACKWPMKKYCSCFYLTENTLMIPNITFWWELTIDAWEGAVPFSETDLCRTLAESSIYSVRAECQGLLVWMGSNI